MFPPLRTMHSRLLSRTTIRLYRPFSVSHPLYKPDPPPQSKSPLAPIGVAAALDRNSVPRPKVLQEFALTDRVGIVTGGNRGIGLEIALALSEAGARSIYCFDLPAEPSEDFGKTRAYVERLGEGRRLVYVSADVRDREDILKKVKEIGDREGRLDVGVAAAGILKKEINCWEYPAEQFKEVYDVNVNGVLWTAQAVGQQMRRFGNGGSIILMASVSGSITNRTKPHLLETWSNLNALGRIGRPDELRGVAAWLASDASSFCTGSE
ncbi:hypothetical protein C0993_007975 [Termitomyces sp. T159_Od127]|nr:hypothetical protein C0993_007975 [Termitomyces sp. T159_Od127]